MDVDLTRDIHGIYNGIYGHISVHQLGIHNIGIDMHWMWLMMGTQWDIYRYIDIYIYIATNTKSGWQECHIFQTLSDEPVFPKISFHLRETIAFPRDYGDDRSVSCRFPVKLTLFRGFGWPCYSSFWAFASRSGHWIWVVPAYFLLGAETTITQVGSQLNRYPFVWTLVSPHLNIICVYVCL